MNPETKGKIKGGIAGVLATAVLVGGGVFAAQRSEMIEVFYDDIKIFVDGEKVDPKDANGNAVQPFIYNGTTYLPVRAVGNAIGKDVAWDGVEKVVYLGAKPGDAENWLNVCGPYQYKNATEYTLAENQYFTMSGQKYTNGFILYPNAWDNHRAEAVFNLNGKYNKVEFTVGHIDQSQERDVTINIYLDGIIAYTTDIKFNDLAKKVSIPLKGALQMRIEAVGHGLNVNSISKCSYGFSEGKFE